ncbi:MAG: DUF1579 domain-containing protein, partial [Terriglobia bacterium]
MRSRVLLVVVVGLLLGWAAPLRAQEQTPQMDPQMMEYLEKYAAPGEHHQHLEMLAGTWTTQATFWPAPGAPTMESTGIAEHHMVLGGRFLQTSYRGDFAGMPFEGMGIVAYDRFLNTYVETWVDNFGTMVLVSKGTCDGTGKVRTVTASFTDPMTGQPTQMRSVYRIVDADHYVLEMYAPAPDGNEYKVMEIAHTR